MYVCMYAQIYKYSLLSLLLCVYVLGTDHSVLEGRQWGSSEGKANSPFISCHYLLWFFNRGGIPQKYPPSTVICPFNVIILNNNIHTQDILKL